MSAKINDGGPACPLAYGSSGMTLRDYFANNVPHDEIDALTYKHLSRSAQEKLAGITWPEGGSDLRGDDSIKHQIAVMRFHARVNAALKFIYADAMLVAREKEDGE